MGPPALVDPLGRAAVAPDEGDPDHVGGRLDGQQDHRSARHGPSASASRSHRSAQAPSSGLTVTARLVVVVGRLQPDEEGSRPEDGLGGVAPLHQGHPAVLDQLAQAQVDDLVEMVEPVDVGVQEHPDRGGPAQRVLADQDEGGAGDRLGDPEGGAEPLGEGGLARAQVPGQQEHVPGRAQPGQGPGQLPGLVGRGGDQGQTLGPGPRQRHRPVGRSGHELHPSSCLARIRSARISATTTPPERRAAAGW